MYKNIDNKIILDENQRRIVLTDEINQMVIAGAGTGKTTTICAKVNYLIEKQKIKDDEIIVISFTNKAVEELNTRINKDFKHHIKIVTFHKLGYEIIKAKKNPGITTGDSIIRKYIKETKNKTKQNSIINPIIQKIKKIINKNEKNNNNEEYIKFCIQYISLFKAKGYNERDFDKIKYKKRREKKFKEFIMELYAYYQKELEKKKLLDFNDMINEANKIIEQKKIKLNYKYIIIDEFQDISENRFKLIKNISKMCNTKIIVVGDDWKCIYGFASSNISLFTKFKNNVEYCEIQKILKTYRNSQQLIDIAGKFVEQNNEQIKKQLISNKVLKNPITILTYKEKKINNAIKETINYIINKYGIHKNILILGRYTFDKNKIIDDDIKEINGKIIYQNNPNIKIDYMTIHSSKGLGYDNVIIINNKNDILGFPSKIKTDSLLEPLITKEQNKYGEERRLFYVAITRTKNEVILLAPKNNYSIFIKEIKKYENVRIKNNKIK